MEKEIYYDYNTKNVMFMIFHNNLKGKGVKNNRFMLAILDPALIGVNPLDPKLSTVMKQKIFKECIENYWYFVREIAPLLLENKYGNIISNSIRLHWCIDNNLNIITDENIENTINIRLLWEFVFNSTAISIIDTSHSESKDALAKIRKLYEKLPEYLRCVKGKRNSQETWSNDLNGSIISAMPGARNKETANCLGRGLIYPRILFNNFIDCNFIDDIYTSAQPAIKHSQSGAELDRKIYGNIIMIDSSKKITKKNINAYNFAKEIENYSAVFNDFLYDEEDLKYSIALTSDDDFVYISKYLD